jgi:hypothetical protein
MSDEDEEDEVSKPPLHFPKTFNYLPIPHQSSSSIESIDP